MKKLLIFVGLVAVALVAVFMCLGIAILPSCSISNPSTTTTTNTVTFNTPQSTTHPTSYSVTFSYPDTGDANIMYTNATGGNDNLDSLRGPWEKTITLPVGTWVYFTVQDSTGSLTGASPRCEIKVNGSVWRQAQSNGAYSIAKCSGTLGAK